MPYQPKPA